MESRRSDDDEMDIDEEMENDDNKESKPNKEKRKPKIIRNTSEDNFLEYFEAYKAKTNYLMSEDDEINKYDFNIEKYSQVFNSLNINSPENLKANKDLLEKNNINGIDEQNFYHLIAELIRLEHNNIFIYGFGSKLRLIYEFLEFFQENVNNADNEDKYYIQIFNCYKPAGFTYYGFR